MKILELKSSPTTEWNAALEKFEAEFQYPLGPDSWFRISHGDDYTRFFRAIGEACCFVATSGSAVVGTITSTICRLRQPGGEFVRGGYLSDLKIAKSTSGHTLLKLFRAVKDWTLTAPTPSFCVVMDGTAKSPVDYTGRVGIPDFVEVAKMVILRIPVNSLARVGDERSAIAIHTCDIDRAQQRYEQLTLDCFATDGGQPSIRSLMSPIGLIAADGNASAVLEDTRRCKRLFRNDGEEMVSAHLSCFGYRSAESGAQLILKALAHCSSLGIPALFVCVRREDVQPLLQHSQLDQKAVVRASATVFGYSFNGPGKWSINSSEI